MNLFNILLKDKRFLWLLLVVNFFGTIYGYYWYRFQLEDTPIHFKIFVPDSPTASLFFCFVLLAFILGRNLPIFEALAVITLIKYGIWAVIMNILMFVVVGDQSWQAYMLIASHGAMAVQAVLYSPYYRIKSWHIIVVAIWTLHNDVIDYIFMQYPKYPGLEQYLPQIAYFTFWLSIACILYAIYVKNKQQYLRID